MVVKVKEVAHIHDSILIYVFQMYINLRCSNVISSLILFGFNY